MAEKTALEIAFAHKLHLQAIEALEAETMALVRDFGEGPTNSMKSYFIHIRNAHSAADKAVKQIPEIAPQFGGK